MYIVAVIQSARLENKHEVFCDMVDRYERIPKTVFFVDRGYESYNNISHVNEKGLYYLFRTKDKKCKRKHVYQVNYTITIHICQYFLSKMAENSPPDVETLFSKEILPVRPGRHNPRKIDHQKAFIFLYRAS